MDLAAYAQQEGAESPQSAIVYGPPRGGKTALVAQLAERYNILWLDLEKGVQTLLNPELVDPALRSKIHLVIVNDTQDDPHAIKTVGKLFCRNAKHVICEEHGAIGCIPCTKDKAATQTWNLYDLDKEWVVVTDSVTQLSDSALAHALGRVDWEDKKKAEYDHWDRQGLLLKNIMTCQKLLKCHRVFISHEEELEHEDGTKMVTPCAGTRNFSRKVARYFDHVVFCNVKNMKHVANSSSTASPKFVSGSRNSVAMESGDRFVDIFRIKEQKPAAATPAKPVFPARK